MLEAPFAEAPDPEPQTPFRLLTLAAFRRVLRGNEKEIANQNNWKHPRPYHQNPDKTEIHMRIGMTDRQRDPETPKTAC